MQSGQCTVRYTLRQCTVVSAQCVTLYVSAQWSVHSALHFTSVHSGQCTVRYTLRQCTVVSAQCVTLYVSAQWSVHSALHFTSVRQCIVILFVVSITCMAVALLESTSILICHMVTLFTFFISFTCLLLFHAMYVILSLRFRDSSSILFFSVHLHCVCLSIIVIIIYNSRPSPLHQPRMRAHLRVYSVLREAFYYVTYL